MRGITDVGETQAISGAPSGPMLPFDRPASNTTRDANTPAPRLPPGLRGFADVHGTPLGPEAARGGSVRPSQPVTPTPPPEPAEAPSWMPAGMRKFVDVEGTQILSDVPAGSSLPFTPPKNPREAVLPPPDDVSEAP